MRSIAVVGSGIAGLVTAHGLRAAGLEVTLYSDRTPEQWLNESRPTGTAARFEPALAVERRLGLNHWEHVAPRGRGVHLTFCPAGSNRLLTLSGVLRESYFQAVDVRLQSARWMADLEARGGKVVVEKVSAERLDQIAAEHALTVVAVGRGELQSLFARDAGRSVYDGPQRKLAMFMVRGATLGFEGVPCLPVKFNFFAPFGEAFWVPYFHKDAGPSWCLLFEAKAGGPMDRFDGATSGEAALELGKALIRDLVPWDYAWVKDVALADPNGWLVGAVTPTVRSPVARLPSGRVVTAVGDTLMSLDPIGGQGANNGTKMAEHLVREIVARGDAPLDEAFLVKTFDDFWAAHGAITYAFNNLLLEPIPPAAREILVAQYGVDGTHADGRQRIADTFIENFADPRVLTPALSDARAARALIRSYTGKAPVRALLGSGLRVARGQVRQLFGLPPGHPAAAPGARALSTD